jgi:hypothetical protein
LIHRTPFVKLLRFWMLFRHSSYQHSLHREAFSRSFSQGSPALYVTVWSITVPQESATGLYCFTNPIHVFIPYLRHRLILSSLCNQVSDVVSSFQAFCLKFCMHILYIELWVLIFILFNPCLDLFPSEKPRHQ